MKFPKYPRYPAPFPRYHPPYPIPYVEVPRTMAYSIYPSGGGFSTPSNPYSKRRNGRKTLLPSSGARMAQLPYAYEDSYSTYAEDIQYSTVLPLIQPLPYTYQWESGWGSANSFGVSSDEVDPSAMARYKERRAKRRLEEGKEKGKWWKNIDISQLGKGISDQWKKGKTKRSSRRASRKGRKKTSSGAKKSRSGFSPNLMKAMSGTPDMEKVFWVWLKNGSRPLPFTQSVLRNAQMFAKSAAPGGRFEKKALPPRTSNLFQAQALKTQPVIKAISNLSGQPQQNQLTVRSQQAEKSVEKVEKSNNTLIAVGGISALLLVVGGSYVVLKARKEK